MNSVSRQFAHNTATSFMNNMDDIRGAFGGFVEGHYFNKFYCKGSLDRLIACSSDPTTQTVSVKFWLCPKVVSKTFLLYPSKNTTQAFKIRQICQGKIVRRTNMSESRNWGIFLSCFYFR